MKPMSRKIYIAGKVTGVPEVECREAFSRAEAELRRLGYEVVNPLTLVGDIRMDWIEAMRICLEGLFECQHIYVLRGWETSKGASVEVVVAEKLGIELIFQ